MASNATSASAIRPSGHPGRSRTRSGQSRSSASTRTSWCNSVATSPSCAEGTTVTRAAIRRHSPARSVLRDALYKGMTYSGVPNLASSFGYTNASWTLKCDLTCEYVCRLLNHMQRRGLRHFTPRNSDATMTTQPWIDFSSGYVQRSLYKFPKQGSRAPWRLHQNYARDIMLLRFGRLEDGVMEFSNPAPVRTAMRA